MKKETLEEASIRLFPKVIADPYNPFEDLNKEERNIWIEGAKWQQEQSKKMKQTPVEWLVEQITNNKFVKAYEQIEAIDQAKEMEQAQRRKDFIAGNECACMCHENIDDYFDKYIFESSKKIDSSKKYKKEFENIVKPVMKWLSENHHPHTYVVIESSTAELCEGKQVFYSNEFLID